MKKLFFILMTALYTSIGYAEGLPWNQHQGPFAELSAGTNLYYVGVFGSKGNVTGGGVRGGNVGGAVGYYYKPYFGVEGGLAALFVSLNRGDQVYVPYLTTRFSVPLGDRFNFLAKLGIMVPFISRDSAAILPFTGIGFSYAITEKAELGLQYQGAVYGIAGAGALGLSLAYHF